MDGETLADLAPALGAGATLALDHDQAKTPPVPAPIGHRASDPQRGIRSRLTLAAVGVPAPRGAEVTRTAAPQLVRLALEAIAAVPADAPDRRHPLRVRRPGHHRWGRGARGRSAAEDLGPTQALAAPRTVPPAVHDRGDDLDRPAADPAAHADASTLVLRKPVPRARPRAEPPLGPSRRLDHEDGAADLAGLRALQVGRAHPARIPRLGGSGRTGIAADRLGRDCTLVELHPGYVAMAARQVRRDAPLMAVVAVAAGAEGAPG
jgi:hypothetical protein